MIVVMKVGSPEAEVTRISQEFEEWGLTPEKIVGHQTNYNFMATNNFF